MAVKKVYTDSREIDLDKIERNGFVDTEKINDALIELEKVKKIIDELIEIRINAKLPKNIVKIIDSYNSNMIGFVNEVESKEVGDPDKIARQKDDVIKRIKNYSNNAFDFVRNPNQIINRLLEVYAIAKSFVNEKDEKNEIQLLKSGYEKTLKETQNTIKQIENNTSVSL